MKSIACILIILVLCNSSAFGGLSRGVFTDERYPGKCVIRDNFILSPGEVLTDREDCARVSCGEDGNAEIETCGVLTVQGCKVGDYVDKNRPYPSCCGRRFICPQ